MKAKDKVNVIVAVHQKICKLIGFRKKLVNRKLHPWLELCYESINAHILILLRHELHKGMEDDICLEKVLSSLEQEKLISTSEYQVKHTKLKIFQDRFNDGKINTIVNKGIAHVTEKHTSIAPVDEIEIDKIVNDISDFIEQEIWQFSDLKDKMSFQARISLYVEFWKLSEEFMLKHKIIK